MDIQPQINRYFLTAKETLVIELKKIVTSHPTGTANLYLRYKYLPDYQDGEFICPIEKAPLVFPETNVGIGTTSPQAKLHVNGGDAIISDNLNFGHTTRQMINLYEQTYGIGVQSSTIYFRTGSQFAWYKGGSHNNNLAEPSGGTLQMMLDSSGNVGIGTKSPQAQLHVTETIQARKIVADGAVFTGMILMWSGAANQIPIGWVLCNGQNGTPDLRDKFIVGAGSSKYPVGNTGGAETVTLTVGQMPKHNHATSSIASAGAHTHEYWFDDEGGGTGPNGIYPQGDGGITTDKKQSTLTAGAHSHSLSIIENGNNEAHENRPPYYALCFIMKVDI